MQRQVMIAAGGGLASALLSLGLLAGGGGFALLAYFAPLPLFFVGLMVGLRASLIAGTFALVVLFLLGGILSAGLYTLSIMAPAWIVIYHALSHRAFANGTTGFFTPGDILARLSALGAAFVALVTLAQMGNDGGVEASIRAFLTGALGPLIPTEQTDEINVFLDRVVPLFPSFATLSWLVMLIANAALAQNLLTRWGKALRASPDYTQVQTPEWSYWLVIAAATLKILSTGDIEYLAQNLVLILGAPFFFVGLAVAHALVRRTRFPGSGLAAFYLFLMLFTWFGALVAAVGFLEPWTRLRDRFGAASAGLAPYRPPDDE
jgi:hypothetical protein